MPAMDTDKQAQIKAHARAIAALLYEDSDPEQLQTLAGIEVAVRSQILEQVSPEIGLFLSKQRAAPKQDGNAPSPVSSADCASVKNKPNGFLSLSIAVGVLAWSNVVCC